MLFFCMKTTFLLKKNAWTTCLLLYLFDIKVFVFISYVDNKFIVYIIEDFLPMNKSELIDAIAEKSGLTKADAGRALDATLASITETLGKGDSITLVGFGTFSVKERKERQGFNPKTKTAITIPASQAPVFKAGKNLKDAVEK